MPKFRLPMLNSLPSFEAAARHQSIQKACKELHVDHASVSRHIHKLEVYIGRALFTRTHSRVALTDDGKLLFTAVTFGFSQIQRAMTQLGRRQDTERLVISVDPDFASLWLVPRLAEFYATVPNTLVEIIAERATLSLQDPRISCAIQYARAGLTLENGDVLFRSRLFPVGAKSWPIASLESIDYLARVVLLHDRSIAEWEEYLRLCAPNVAANVRSGVVFSDTALCLDAAARGQGVALGDDFLAATHLSEGRLVQLSRASMLSENAYYFLAPEIASRHPMMDSFRTWLLHGIERQRADFYSV